MFKDYIDAFRHYADFSGRATRSLFWGWVFANVLVAILLVFAQLFLRDVGVWISGAYYLIAFIPSLAVGVRRLHDINKSGWWILIGFVPLVGGIVLLVFYCMKSVDAGNRFGGSAIPQPPVPPIPPVTPTQPTV